MSELLRKLHIDELPKKSYRLTEDTRICLKCDKRFESAGPHNRLCDSCGHANAKYDDDITFTLVSNSASSGRSE